MTRAAAAPWLALLLATATAASGGCSTDVNLGTSLDAGGPPASGPDAAPLDCQPCLEQGDCAVAATCGVFSGDSFCAMVCPDGGGCEADETCDTITTVGGTAIRACVPNGGQCAPQVGPQVDGGAIERCGGLNGPTVASPCKSCGKYSSDCQANGCYGGWWCNTATRKCQKPPTTCP